MFHGAKIHQRTSEVPQEPSFVERHEVTELSAPLSDPLDGKTFDLRQPIIDRRAVQNLVSECIRSLRENWEGNVEALGLPHLIPKDETARRMLIDNVGRESEQIYVASLIMLAEILHGSVPRLLKERCQYFEPPLEIPSLLGLASDPLKMVPLLDELENKFNSSDALKSDLYDFEKMKGLIAQVIEHSCRGVYGDFPENTENQKGSHIRNLEVLGKSITFFSPALRRLCETIEIPEEPIELPELVSNRQKREGYAQQQADTLSVTFKSFLSMLQYGADKVASVITYPFSLIAAFSIEALERGITLAAGIAVGTGIAAKGFGELISNGIDSMFGLLEKVKNALDMGTEAAGEETDDRFVANGVAIVLTTGLLGGISFAFFTGLEYVANLLGSFGVGSKLEPGVPISKTLTALVVGSYVVSLARCRGDVHKALQEQHRLYRGAFTGVEWSVQTINRFGKRFAALCWRAIKKGKGLFVKGVLMLSDASIALAKFGFRTLLATASLSVWCVRYGIKSFTDGLKYCLRRLKVWDWPLLRKYAVTIKSFLALESRWFDFNNLRRIYARMKKGVFKDFSVINSREPLFKSNLCVAEVFVVGTKDGKMFGLREVITPRLRKNKSLLLKVFPEKTFNSLLVNDVPGENQTFFDLAVSSGEMNLPMPPGYEVCGLRFQDGKGTSFGNIRGKTGVRLQENVFGSARVKVPASAVRVQYLIQARPVEFTKSELAELLTAIGVFPVYLGARGENFKRALDAFPISPSEKTVMLYANQKELGFKFTGDRLVYNLLRYSGGSFGEMFGGLRLGPHEPMSVYLANMFLQNSVPAVILSGFVPDEKGGDFALNFNKAHSTTAVLSESAVSLFDLSIESILRLRSGVRDIEGEGIALKTANFSLAEQSRMVVNIKDMTNEELFDYGQKLRLTLERGNSASWLGLFSKSVNGVTNTVTRWIEQKNLNVHHGLELIRTTAQSLDSYQYGAVTRAITVFLDFQDARRKAIEKKSVEILFDFSEHFPCLPPVQKSDIDLAGETEFRDFYKLDISSEVNEFAELVLSTNDFPASEKEKVIDMMIDRLPTSSARRPGTTVQSGDEAGETAKKNKLLTWNQAAQFFRKENLSHITSRIKVRRVLEGVLNLAFVSPGGEPSRVDILRHHLSKRTPMETLHFVRTIVGIFECFLTLDKRDLVIKPDRLGYTELDVLDTLTLLFQEIRTRSLQTSNRDKALYLRCEQELIDGIRMALRTVRDPFGCFVENLFFFTRSDSTLRLLKPIIYERGTMEMFDISKILAEHSVKEFLSSESLNTFSKHSSLTNEEIQQTRDAIIYLRSLGLKIDKSSFGIGFERKLKQSALTLSKRDAHFINYPNEVNTPASFLLSASVDTPTTQFFRYCEVLCELDVLKRATLKAFWPTISEKKVMRALVKCSEIQSHRLVSSQRTLHLKIGSGNLDSDKEERRFIPSLESLGRFATAHSKGEDSLIPIELIEPLTEEIAQLHEPLSALFRLTRLLQPQRHWAETSFKRIAELFPSEFEKLLPEYDHAGLVVERTLNIMIEDFPKEQFHKAVLWYLCQVVRGFDNHGLKRMCGLVEVMSDDPACLNKPAEIQGVLDGLNVIRPWEEDAGFRDLAASSQLKLLVFLALIKGWDLRNSGLFGSPLDESQLSTLSRREQRAIKTEHHQAGELAHLAAVRARDMVYKEAFVKESVLIDALRTSDRLGKRNFSPMTLVWQHLFTPSRATEDKLRPLHGSVSNMVKVLQKRMRDVWPRFIFSRGGSVVVKARAGDFLELKEYNRERDDYRSIDWKTSSRTDKWYVRNNQDEETRNLTLVYDIELLLEGYEEWQSALEAEKEAEEENKGTNGKTLVQKPRALQDLFAILNVAAGENRDVSLRLYGRSHVHTFQRVVRSRPGKPCAWYEREAFSTELSKYLDRAAKILKEERTVFGESGWGEVSIFAGDDRKFSEPCIYLFGVSDKNDQLSSGVYQTLRREQKLIGRIRIPSRRQKS